MRCCPVVGVFTLRDIYLNGGTYETTPDTLPVLGLQKIELVAKRQLVCQLTINTTYDS